MAPDYRLTPLRRLVNLLVAPLARFGVAGPRVHLLTVRGRKSGQPHSTPVSIVIRGDERWLVAPYGEREWVKNARAAGEVQLTRGRRTTTYRIEEVGSERAGPVLREYVRSTPVVRTYFEAKPGDDVAAFAAEADRHPVFRLLSG